MARALSTAVHKLRDVTTFGRPVDQVMSEEPYASARRVFWVVDNGGSHRGPKTEARLRERWPSIRVVRTPIHASWLNQVELCFSIVQRKVLDPNQWSSRAALDAALLAFGERYSAIAEPFEWRVTRLDRHRVLAARTPLAKGGLRSYEARFGNQRG